MFFNKSTNEIPKLNLVMKNNLDFLLSFYVTFLPPSNDYFFAEEDDKYLLKVTCLIFPTSTLLLVTALIFAVDLIAVEELEVRYFVSFDLTTPYVVHDFVYFAPAKVDVAF